MKEVVKIVIDKNGFRFIYSDGLKDLLDTGRATVRRASHVEPVQVYCPGTDKFDSWWQADMAPCGGPKLPPCRTRAEALAAEAAWLLGHGIPEPKPEPKEYKHEPNHIILSRGYGEGD